jgi:5-deoxy-glucuronate isomerase
MKRQYDAQNLVIPPGHSSDPDVVVEVLPQQAGWDTLTFQVRRLPAGKQWSFQFSDQEMALVVLSGTLDVRSDRGSWTDVGEREHVFTGLPYALYLPPATSLTVTAQTDCEFAAALAPADQDHPPRLITPRDIQVEIRGGDHATRQINDIIPPGFDCQRLVVCEVYTPGGNWSSYPPHKHDNRRVSPDGALLEADLDEIYYYKIDRPEGYAIQRIYTDDTSPLQGAGLGFDAPVVLKNDCVALVPEGYHPVSSPPGYTTYYLNILAGSDQSLQSHDDPHFAWIKDSYQSHDPRVPIYPIPEKKK